MEEDYIKRDIMGFCDYCHSEIRAEEDYNVVDNKIYHKECWDQKNLYIDVFDICNDN